MEIRRDYFPVFHSNVGNIGLLKNPLPALLVQFYVQINSVLEDMETYHSGSLEGIPTSDLIASHIETLRLFKDTLAIGTSIIEKGETLYPLSKD